MRESTMWATQGGPIVGEIRNGKKYPFGTVSATQYEEDMATLNAEISGLNAAVVACQGSLTGLTAALDTLSGQYAATVPGLSQAVSDIRVQVAEVSTALTALTNTQNVDRATLTARIAAAENSVSALAQTVEGYNTTLNNQISGLRADITVNSQDIAVIKSALQTQGAAISQANADIAAVSERMNTLEVAMATLRQQLLNSTTNLQDEIERINTDKAAIKADLTTLTADEAIFKSETESSLAELNMRVTALEESELLLINSFTAAPEICEIGGHENIILSWDVQGTIRAAYINDELVTGNQKVIPNVSEATSYTLHVVGVKGVTQKKTISVKFCNHIFWGTSASDTPTEGVVKSLDNTELSEDRARVITSSPNNEYIYYAYPKRLGTSEFIVNGFAGGFEDPVIVSINNHSEYSEEYYVYRSANKLRSTFDVHII